MASSSDYPKLLSPALQAAIQDRDLGEAVVIFGTLRAEVGDSLELWAELLDELTHHGYGWPDWAELWPGGEAKLAKSVYFLVLGIQALQEESFERASYYLHRAAESAPESPVPLAYLGIMYESQGCPSEAIAYYKRCLAIAPRLFSVLNAVGNLYHELGFYADAVTHYRQAAPLLQEPCNQAILLGNLGNSLRALGQLDEAIAVYTEAIALDPAQPSPPIFLAETLLEAERTGLAISCLTDLMTAPTFDEWPPEVQSSCYGLLARAYWHERQYPASVLYTWLRNGSRLNEDDREATSALLKGLFAWAIAEPSQPVNQFLLAKLNRHLGYLDAAVHHAKRAVKLAPQKAEHFIELGATLLLQGKVPVALEALEEAATLAPERADVHSYRAMACWEEDWEEALEAVQSAIRLEPNQALHRCDLAYLHQVGDDAEQTQEAFQRAILLWDAAPILYGPHGPVTQRGCYSDVTEPYLAENATSPEAVTRLLIAANFLILSRRREPARKALHRLLSEHPAHLDALRNYAWILTRGGWNEEALSVWRRVLSLAPGDDVSRYFALLSLSRQGSEGKASARREVEKALETRPRYHLGRLLLANLAEPGPEALEALEILCRQLPDIYSVWYMRGRSLFHRREFEAALAFLERSVALNPRFAPSRQLLSECLRVLGQDVRAEIESGAYYYLTHKYHLARQRFEEALWREPGHVEAQRGLSKVERRIRRLESPTPADLYLMVCPRYRIY